MISESKAILTKNTNNSVIEIPLIRSQPFNFAAFDTLKDEDFENFRKYLFLIQHPYLKFTIENEISEKIQKDFISERSKNEDYLPEDLDRNINFSKLYAVSYGILNLKFEDYCKIKELEIYRKKRIAENTILSEIKK